MSDILIIGIAGGTGSGKTTLTHKLSDYFGENASVLYFDDYYKVRDDLTPEQRKTVNYDHPDAFDTELMLSHVKALKNGQTVLAPVYDFTVHNRKHDEFRQVNAGKVVIIDGLFALYDPRIRELMDIKLYVDTDADVRILRRVARDINERGRTLENIIQQYLTTVKPMHEQFIEPSKRYADVIIPEGGNNNVAVDMVIKLIEHNM